VGGSRGAAALGMIALARFYRTQSLD